MKLFTSFFLFFVFVSNIGCACDCDKILDFKNATCVFIGKVKSIDYVDSPGIRYSITFDVLRSFKGQDIKKNIVVHVMCLKAACCGFPFEVNGFYFVYASEENNILYTGDCTQNAILRSTSYLLQQSRSEH